MQKASVAIPDEITGEAIVVFFVADSKNDSGLEQMCQIIFHKKLEKLAKPKYSFSTI